MEFYFLDESGDQGAKGSKHLILTLVKLNSAKKAAKIIRDARQHLNQKTIKKRWLEQHGGEIKFSTFPDKEYLFKMMGWIGKLKPEIIYVVADKKGLPFETRQKILPILFEVALGEGSVKRIIADLDFVGRNSEYFALTKSSVRYTDRAGKRTQRVDISLTNIKRSDISSVPTEIPIIEIKHQNSRMCDELQLVDLISGAIFCNFEHSEERYIKSLKEAGAVIRKIRSDIRK